MQRKIILVGEIVLDKNYIIKRQGKAAEFNSPKSILLKTKFNLGGAGMVYSALKQIHKNLDFFSISHKSNKNIISASDRKNIIFDGLYKLEKKRFWEKKDLILQINDVKKSKKFLLRFQSLLIEKINKIKSGTIVLLSDYRNGIFTEKFTKKVIKILKSKNIEILLDQQSTSTDPDLLKFKGIDYLFLNERELFKSFKIYKIRNLNLKKAIVTLQNKIGINKLVVKLGQSGCLYSDKQCFVRSKAYKVLKNVNTIGAGDFFIAKFVTLYLYDIKKRLSEANKYAYLKIVGKLKTKNLLVK